MQSNCCIYPATQPSHVVDAHGIAERLVTRTIGGRIAALLEREHPATGKVFDIVVVELVWVDVL